MKEESAIDAKAQNHSASSLQGFMRNLFWSRMEKLRQGRLVCIEGAQRRVFGGPAETALAATIEICDPRFFLYVVFVGSLGAAEAYIEGFWCCDDLVALVRIFCRNADALRGIEAGAGRILNLFRTAAHWFPGTRDR
jgi:cyclopropane-fatty-acyl-phospholipid synthase